MDKRYECGTRASYSLDRCRCEPCTVANREYARTQYRRMMGYEERPTVPADTARKRLKALLREGYSLRTIAKAINANEIALARLLKQVAGRPRAKRVRRITERKLLDFEMGDVIRAEYGFVPAAPIWSLVNGLLAAGMTKAAIARHITPGAVSLQIGHLRVGWRTAKAIMELYREVIGGNPYDVGASKYGTVSSDHRLDDLLTDTLWGEWMTVNRIVHEYTHRFGGNPETVRRSVMRWLKKNEGSYQRREVQAGGAGASFHVEIYVESPY